MPTLSVVIPALNEAENMPAVLESIPLAALREAGWETDVIVVDNASTDDTAAVAGSLGARVVVQPDRGYGNAYHAGFDAARGEVIATGDADCTYPFDRLPELLGTLVERDIEFMTTDRLHRDNRSAMKASHTLANHALSALSRALFRNGLRDSQSGMWIFRRHVWHGIDVRSTGMSFSQEIKNSATRAGYRFLEVPIEYRRRQGEVKLRALPDGMGNLRQLFAHRFRRPAPRLRPVVPLPRQRTVAEGAGECGNGRAEAV
ncbi:glycosyltransferase family 2 protein [Streptomyces smaragdinus]|uniref:glycosyltransferase family 2 protein n=1 Tax=Streptomyces smaragdinus TaxID=2585196 RepID=UPI002B20627A|nr:glycosyltransferase family 2 protein [Streptomyces smaragdinus]